MSGAPPAADAARPAGAAGLGFAVLARDGAARRGRFRTAHGVVDTPAFMPVGTQAAIKCAFPQMVADSGAQVVLANTYHLSHPERVQLVERHGGLHALMRWPRSILTDSGGFQVFSLPGREVSEDGVRFRFTHDEQPVMLTPESAMELQRRLGADIVMAFDECVAHDAPPAYVAESLARTERWLQRCRRVPLAAHQHLFGIVQGGMDLELRARAARAIVAHDLPGYAIGGVSVGEGHEAMIRVVRHTAPLLPADRPRYLMGVGLPEDIVAAVDAGMDLFDCVIPTRYAREGTAFTWQGKLRLKDKRYRKDRYPIDTACSCPACAGGFSRAYLRHLLFAGETLGEMLITAHNLWFYQDLMRGLRAAIEAGRLAAWRAAFAAKQRPPLP
ncbi:MAG: tRNA guanosine(34) transglycosylase Tgt [Planctomycetota bacterium]|nr:tRNA guanosine(34) transglycosylase Tgt [Planctomycetota bacterium]